MQLGVKTEVSAPEVLVTASDAYPNRRCMDVTGNLSKPARHGGRPDAGAPRVGLYWNWTEPNDLW